MIEQMYVHYRLPANAKNYPIVFVHGGGLTGQSYETTPDGREGWGTYFARKGFPTYVVDFPTRGRAAFKRSPSTRASTSRIGPRSPRFRAVARSACGLLSALDRQTA